MPSDIKAFRVTLFYRDRSYVLSAAGPETDVALSEAAFQSFVASFKLTDAD